MAIDALLASAAMATAAGLIGCFAVMRRMSLAADALSHVALPGIGIALALHIHPVFGAAAMLFFGAVLVWALESRSRAATETVVGVVFSAALAAGSLMASRADLLDALFGGAGTLSLAETAFGLVAAAAVIGFVLRERHRLVLVLVSADVARTAGVHVRRLNLLYLMMFALTIALGLRYLGVLLMGALIIVPAAVARQVARSLSAMLATAVAVAVVATVTGTAIAAWSHHDSGPVIVLITATLYAFSLLRLRG